jgi:hypothetical protein
LVLQGGSFAEDESLASRVASDPVFAELAVDRVARRCACGAIVAGFFVGHVDAL